MGSSFLERLKASLGAASSEPIYRRIVQETERAISDGTLKRDALLPSERELADALNVSRVTIRKSLDVLVEDGLVRRHQGSRTRVKARVEKSLSTLASFSEDMISRGLAPGCIWISREISGPTPVEAMALGLSPATQVARLRRIRTADGTPIAVETAVLPASVLPDLDAVEESLYAVLERAGALPQRALQRMQAGQATPLDAEQLNLDLPASLLVVERRCFLGSGEAVEFTQTRYRGDVYDFVLELRR